MFQEYSIEMGFNNAWHECVDQIMHNNNSDSPRTPRGRKTGSEKNLSSQMSSDTTKSRKAKISDDVYLQKPRLFEKSPRAIPTECRMEMLANAVCFILRNESHAGNFDPPRENDSLQPFTPALWQINSMRCVSQMLSASIPSQTKRLYRA